MTGAGARRVIVRGHLDEVAPRAAGGLGEDLAAGAVDEERGGLRVIDARGRRDRKLRLGTSGDGAELLVGLRGEVSRGSVELAYRLAAHVLQIIEGRGGGDWGGERERRPVKTRAVFARPQKLTNFTPVTLIKAVGRVYAF